MKSVRNMYRFENGLITVHIKIRYSFTLIESILVHKLRVPIYIGDLDRVLDKRKYARESKEMKNLGT